MPLLAVLQYVTYTKELIESGDLANETLDRAVGNIIRYVAPPHWPRRKPTNCFHVAPL